MPESKFLNKNKNKTHHNNGSMSKGPRSQLKELPMAKAEQSEQQSKAVLGYNPK